MPTLATLKLEIERADDLYGQAGWLVHRLQMRVRAEPDGDQRAELYAIVERAKARAARRESNALDLRSVYGDYEEGMRDAAEEQRADAARERKLGMYE